MTLSSAHRFNKIKGVIRQITHGLEKIDSLATYDILSHMVMTQLDPKISKEREKYGGYLENNGLKMTPARLKVFKIVIDTHGHFAPEEISKICQDKNVDVSRATVYRSIRELLEAGVVRKTAFGEKHDNFEHIYDEKPHHHARCIRCSTIMEFSDLGEDKMYRDQLEAKGFQILGHEMHFYGICKKCQNTHN